MKPAELEAVFARIPQLAGRAPDEFTITTLPGYTNRNLRLHDGEQDWVLRVPRASTDRFVDREAEAHNQAKTEKPAAMPNGMRPQMRRFPRLPIRSSKIYR